MSKYIKKAVTPLIAIAGLALGSISMTAAACGNQGCDPIIDGYQEIGAHVWSEGGFGAMGEGHNGSNGPHDRIVNRSTISESDGFIDLYARGAKDECADCEGNSLGVSVQGGAFQRNYSGIETNSGHSNSSVHGGASLEGAATASRWRINQ